MATKHHLIFLVILLIISVMLFVYLNIPQKEGKRYSDNPKAWVESKGNIKVIDVESATSGAGSLDFFGEQYNDKNITTAFRYSGFYHGKYFEEEFIDEDSKVKMRINNGMKPNDGIIEGFIIEKIKDGKPIVYVFVDEDWKKKLGRTYIRHGMNFEHNKIFTYKQISDGVYMDTFEDAPERFMEDYTIHFGGVIVGDVSKEKVDNGDEDITLMKFV